MYRTLLKSYKTDKKMKKVLLTLVAALILTSCDNLFKAKTPDASAVNDTINIVSDTAIEEGEPTTEDEAPGLALYEPELLDIDQIPETAERQDSYFQYAVYVNIEQEPSEYDLEGIYSVWWADERTGTAIKVLTTNPTADGNWDKMSKENHDAVDVPMHLIATASQAYLAPGDVSKIIVEGCPDARNIWTYIIDTRTNTAKQLPSTEGVQELNWDNKEIIVASYGYYPEGGRYTYSEAYSLDGKFLRQTSEPEAE